MNPDMNPEIIPDMNPEIIPDMNSDMNSDIIPDMNSEVCWKILDKFFEENPTALVSHHIESYNDFMNHGIPQIFREKNPIFIAKNITKSGDYKYQAKLYLGGKKGEKIYFGKPIIFDKTHEHYMYPNHARLRNFTYGVSIHYDVDVEVTINEEGTDAPINKNFTLDKIYLGRFPIMLRSDLCILNGFDKQVRYTMGECRNDLGGYFIIDGKEKTIISQEKFADNMLYVKDKVNDIYSHSAEIRSVSEDASKPIRTFSIRIVAPNQKFTNNNIVVNIPNVRQPIPLFILMRALGILSDKEIITCCLLDIEKYNYFVDLFIPSIHDAGFIFTQEVALNYIGTFTKGKSRNHVLEILMNYLLPNIGELNFKEKACFIGYMVFDLLKVFVGEKKPTDRDSFKFKRVELPGQLLYDLFKEYYTLQQRDIALKMDKEYYYNTGVYQDNFETLITNNSTYFFSSRIVEDGFKKAFKGNWGAETHTKRLGVVQDVSRLSFNSYISLMRKINLPMDSSAKIVGPRLLHSSQWGIVDPVDTPDGANIGFHKHMSIMSKITKNCSGSEIIKWLEQNTELEPLSHCEFLYMGNKTKLFVNGNWIGVVKDAKQTYDFLILNRRLAVISIYVSIAWNIKEQTITLFTDAGRMCHPLYYIENKTLSITRVMDFIYENKFTWNQLISGFNKKNDTFNVNSCKTYASYKELYRGTMDSDLKELATLKSCIEYIDTSEKDTHLICFTSNDIPKKNYSHMEIHPSLILGVMGNQIVFPENNPLPRDLFSCGQSKQAISLYHTNFNSRFDKTGLVLHYGQIPLIKSRYLKYINNEEHPYGINVIVAIACYGGYNVEDSILFNKASIDRGLFRNTYYSTYEDREDSSKVGNSQVDSIFANIETHKTMGLKPGYDYSDLDEDGLIKENTLMDETKAMIGKIMTTINSPEISMDASVFPKKGQTGFVDKTYITEGAEGYRLAKVRIRDERIPAVGDKFCSRCGQKGTLGLAIEEKNMPFSAEGIIPDIIINPHALPSRMTIGQLLETIMGKACCELGTFAECTAFNNVGSKYKSFGRILTKLGFHSSANEVLYNGESGEQIRMNIFMGPSYYMRLKHIVKDKINYRAKGPRTALTRQTVQGRANDGGLRVGEQERDAIVAHGLSYFLKESMLVRGDEYYMAICNLTGLTAIYNTSLDLFISPYADGPIKFVGSMESEKKIDKITKFGKDFSIIRIPYAFKLLMQELTTLNVSMRIITDKNIDQLESMNSINITSFTDFDKEMLPILTSLKSEIIQPSIPMPETPETPETQEEAIKNAASEEEPINTTEESINQQFVKLAQVIDDNFIKTEQEQAKEQLEEISLEELIPKPNSTPAISNVGVNDIINPENSLSKFQEDEMDQSGQSGQSDSSGQSGQSDSSGQSSQSDSSGQSGQSSDSNPSGQSGNQSKVIKLGEQ
jgi:DNA-directed RNA polymerase II subunit RPB2